MTRDEIIRMAREACDPDKVDAWSNGFWTLTQCELERFASIVRAQQDPRQEPFGYFRPEPFGWEICAEGDEGAVALYEAPPGRQPLTDEEILKMWDDTRNDPIAPSVFCFIACVRHVERAHGIGEQK